MNPRKENIMDMRQFASLLTSLLGERSFIMDIRVINGEGNVINVSRMHITVNNQYLIALTEDMKSTITIERCKDEEEATQFLRWIKEAIKCGLEEESDNILIDLEEKEDGKRQDS